ncbi:hypothetical protein K2Z83_20560 [Oscillochloris sp. ZM17-4]|uniref:NACHT domain-containing protein n=1 Tax=Oscillochloris sp. ZM17-4 TaxID=2866714 RepID=UPI001C73B729|nr:hypothetical protein [Oscillochloris sp. ZM17-4]MBX0330064.1 hypothetical protein [Oscillochloris sp. ZM17-4]
MADLESRLRTLFNERSARRLAPASLLAVGCGVALGGVALGAPALATGAGLVIGNIAVNIASSWIERLAMLPVEAEAERIELLEQGLADRDRGALAVAAATLAAAGPQVAAALPDASRDQLAATLGQGMAEAGGPLAALAPAYMAALQAPAQADWAAIRAEAQQQIQILARVQAGDRATVERSGISVADTEASVDASVIAGNDARISDSPIRIQGVRQPQPGYGISAGAGGTVKDSPLTVITNNLPDPEAARRRADVLGYLDLTQHARNALDLSKIDPTDASYARPMELARVYIALNTTSTVEAEGEQRAERQRPLSAIEVIGRAPRGRVMLLGAPGSGKSTFVSHLAHGLAEAALVAIRKTPDAAKALEQLPGWRYGALLPVPIILRDLAALPAVAAARRGSVGLIYDFLKAQAAEQGCAHAAEPLIAALRAGKALLMLDGLDEVVGDAVLPRVAEAIGDAAKAFPGPILVTCRVLDYQEERLRQLAGFQTHTLADLEPAQIDTFIAAWYAELADSGRRPAAQAAAEARQMQGAVQSRDELRALASTPLLLTLMAQVHAFRGTLPDARARLYDECIDLLLLTWRQPRDGEESLIARLGLSRFGSNDLLTLMARLGFTAHSLTERDQRSSGPADLSESQVLEVLAERFADYDPDPVRCQTRAATVLQALARGNGLLLKRGPKTYTFAHRTFQEFLAGFHLKGMRNAQAECLERATQLHWHEALLLLAGYQVLRESELERPIALAEKLLARSPLEQVLAGDLLVLVGAERARGFDATLVANGGLWPRVVKALREIQASGRPPAAPAALRHRAGLALGRLCYGELKDLARPGGRPPAPDPRLPLAVVGIPALQTDGWRKVFDEHYWCRIEPGPFWFGDDRNEPLKQAQIVQPYQIGPLPVDQRRLRALPGRQRPRRL